MKKRSREIVKFIKKLGGTEVSIRANGRDHLKVAFMFSGQRGNFTFPQSPRGGGEMYKWDIKKFMRKAQGDS